MKLRPVLVNLVAMGLACLVALSVAELAIGWLYPRSESYFVLPANRQTSMLPAVATFPGVDGVAEYRTSSLGIRGEEFGPDGEEYRILAIGGSTTQNAYLDQTETWTLLLGELLGETADGRSTWTGDVGRSGHTARSHVVQFERLVPRLPELDAVIMLVGVNDLTVALRQGFAYEAPPPLSDPQAERAQIRQAFLRIPGGIREQATVYQQDDVHPVKRLALYQLAVMARSSMQQRGSGTGQDRTGAIQVVWRQHRAGAAVVHDSLPDLTEAIGVYRGYLRSIATMARELDVRLILVTQPALWREDLTEVEEAQLWLGGIGDFQAEPGHEYFASAALGRAMDAYNATLLGVCAELGVECVDVAAALPRDLDTFYDDVHFTEAGSRLVAEHLAEYLLGQPPYAPR